MQIKIETNFADIARQLAELPEQIGSKATASALNKTMAQAKTAMSRGIRAEFMMSAAKVNQALRVNKASAKGGLFQMEASLESPRQQGRSLNLINFTARQNKSGLLSVKIKRTGGRKPVAGAFIGNKGRTVFERVAGTTMASRSKYAGTKHAQEIKAVQTIDVAQMFNTKRINAAVVELVETKFPEVFDHEVKFYMDKFNGK